ncbi:MAG TPA: class I SAM-dependent methyltransferase [Aridibacter sp.]|nr:class I SAM-dependent methyltransferase [Aridibacter sp.]
MKDALAERNEDLKILDIGCGKNKVEGSIGLDYNPRTAADVIHDLGDVPYPFGDNEFDVVVSRHVIEHVPDVIAFVEELYRITKPGGKLDIVTPHYTNPDWAADPTHRNHLNSYSFNSFIPERQVFDFYTEARLKPEDIKVTLANVWRSLGIEFLVNLDRRWPRWRFVRKFWEHYLSTVMRGKDLRFVFTVIKDHPDPKA